MIPTQRLRKQPPTAFRRSPCGRNWIEARARLLVDSGRSSGGPGRGVRRSRRGGLIFKGIGFVQDVAVGKTLTVANPGTYRIVMVKQPSDDNILKLVVSNTIRATAEVGPSRSRWIRRRAVAGRRLGAKPLLNRLTGYKEAGRLPNSHALAPRLRTAAIKPQ
jgi:hypothetical protein